MKDLNIKVTARNARLLAAIRENHDSIAAFSREFGFNHGEVGKLVNHVKSPLAYGDWSDLAMNMATALGKYPDELWPEHMRKLQAKKSSTEVHMDAEELAQIGRPANTEEAAALLAKWMDDIRPRESLALSLFLEGRTLKEIGVELGGVSPEGARQIVVRGKRSVKAAARRDGIRGFSDLGVEEI